MANSDSSTPLPSPAPLAPKKENITPIGSKIAELNESRTELLSRIQGLKQDMQNWRSKLDTQVKIYRNELSELKKSLNVEVEQLRSEFQELRNTLQQQQEDVTTSLKNLGLQDSLADAKDVQDPKVEDKDEEIHASAEEDTGKKAEN
ncbi:hypothetical protein P3X46_005970 [Hevea brasiliensis]|uniref:Uncharacterized protein n=1 Tax=Hevea brasiliensis TaxID=3981 RepID=A0ABQ9MNS8_HEVBR|nr:uncharacterized protein LOC110642845 isoform X3 [Hevea brasiliensis]KAJ9181927.1 hypothetical protein P3X46_005970 [Hevea brasiliensis]